jgi:hypothetical protein
MTRELLRPFLSNSGFSFRLSVSFGMASRGKEKQMSVIPQKVLTQRRRVAEKSERRIGEKKRKSRANGLACSLLTLRNLGVSVSKPLAETPKAPSAPNLDLKVQIS